MRLPRLTILYPCYNDRRTIAKMIIRGMQVGPEVTDDFGIPVINDGSRTDTALVLEEMCQLGPGRPRVFQEARPNGYRAVGGKGVVLSG